MNDEQFDEVLRDAAHTYRKPPTPDFDAMWSNIETRWATEVATEEPRSPAEGTTPFAHRSSRLTQRLAIAATLVIGVALGRASMAITEKPADSRAVAAAAAMPYEEETSRYLGQTAALLIALPSEVKAGRADEHFVSRAADLLGRTRLLMDSPAATDPRMRDLLEDLELVLAQVVRLQNDTTSGTELDLINRALEQRDVIPRLRTAVTDINAN
jgi:hypothetical protein